MRPKESSRNRRFCDKPYRAFVAAALSTALASCASTSPTPQHVAAASTPYPVETLVGSWGVASFRAEKDRARTEVQARAQCKLPYVIKKGPTDGVMMHVADDPTPHELKLKSGPDGRTYLGFEGPPGDDQDREILSMNNNMFVARFVNSDSDARYGTFIYVRCYKPQA